MGVGGTLFHRALNSGGKVVRSVWERTVGTAANKRGKKWKRRQAANKQKRLRQLRALNQTKSVAIRRPAGNKDKQIVIRENVKLSDSEMQLLRYYQSKEFLDSREWQELRYEVLVERGRVCMCCGARPPGVIIHVDHIKPRFTHPHLSLDKANLQVLCKDCNFGKGAKYEHDFRPKTK